MLKLGRYPHKKIQSSHLKMRGLIMHVIMCSKDVEYNYKEKI